MRYQQGKREKERGREGERDSKSARDEKCEFSGIAMLYFLFE